MTPLLFADAELAQLIATAALLPAEKRAAFVQRVVAALAAGKSFLKAMAAAERNLARPDRPLSTGAARVAARRRQAEDGGRAAKARPEPP
jgi:hypothetical protein